MQGCVRLLIAALVACRDERSDNWNQYEMTNDSVQHYAFRGMLANSQETDSNIHWVFYCAQSKKYFECKRRMTSMPLLRTCCMSSYKLYVAFEQLFLPWLMWLPCFEFNVREKGERYLIVEDHTVSIQWFWTYVLLLSWAHTTKCSQSLQIVKYLEYTLTDRLQQIFVWRLNDCASHTWVHQTHNKFSGRPQFKG